MKTIICLLVFSGSLVAQSPQESLRKEFRDKHEAILRYQDTRTMYDGKLVSLIDDRDPAIRSEAITAFGSMQDTTVLSLLVEHLSDHEATVQSAAAFAIGQTAGFLSKKNKETLEHDLLWTRLEKMNMEGNPSPADRLIEEIGKFGTQQALDDLLQRFGNVYPQPHQNAIIMSIARFAIRNISSAEAVNYLMKLIIPEEAATWQMSYALQRIGDRQEIRSNIDHIVKLWKHKNPLVRMNLATLLGKLKDEQSSLEPLQKMAEYDGDWRVRVNAVKALGNFNLKDHPDIVQTFRRLFYNENTYTALTALSSFGNSNAKNDSTPAVHEAFAALEKITRNDGNQYLWQLQAEAAGALAKLEGRDAFAFIRPTDFPQPLLQAQLLIAMGRTGSAEALPVLLGFVNDEKPVLVSAALEGLQELSNRNRANKEIVRKTIDACIAALGKHDMAIVTTTSSILGDSLFHTSESVEPLIQELDHLRLPEDVEAMQQIASTLGALNDARAVDVLKKQLEQPDRSVALAASSALLAITGHDYQDKIPKYFQPRYQDLDFTYLQSLADTIVVKMETIHGDVTMALYKNVAPFTVMSFLKLASQRSYFRGLTFHRVVPNFVVQGGDPRGDGWGGPGYEIRSEFSSLRYETGTLGMASAGKDTEGSQFFITQSPQPHLDGRYTIFGKVISGMDVVNRILVDDHIYDVKPLH